MSTTTSLYDRRRDAPAVISEPGLTETDILTFCEAYDLGFVAMGSPKNWRNTSVFWALVKNCREKSKSVPLSRVREWKLAIEAMGPKTVDNTPYIHYRTGETCVARYCAYDLVNKCKVVVFENEAGRFLTLPYDGFFSVSVDAEKKALVPRFAPVPKKPDPMFDLELYNLET